MIHAPSAGATIAGTLDSVPHTPRSRAASPISGTASSASAHPTENTAPYPRPNNAAYANSALALGYTAKPIAASVIGTPATATTTRRSSESESVPATMLDAIAPTSAAPATRPVRSDASCTPITSLKKNSTYVFSSVMPSTIQPRATSVTPRSWRSRTIACTVSGALAAAFGINVSVAAATTMIAAAARSAKRGARSAAHARPSTVPTSVIAPRTPADIPHAERGTTSGSNAW